MSLFLFLKIFHHSKTETLKTLSDSMSGIPECSLGFEYEDIKYIIIKHKEDYDILSSYNLDKETFDNITYKNAIKLLGI